MHFFLLFVRELIPVSGNFTQLQDCRDGLLWVKLMQQLPRFPQNAHTNLHPRTFIDNFRNLKALLAGVEEYWRTQIGREVLYQEIDLVQIAESGDAGQTLKLITLLLKTLLHSNDRQMFIAKILTLTEDVQRELQRMSVDMLKVVKESPRKIRQLKMYDKIIELDTENQKLQSIIQELYDQRKQMQQKNGEMEQKLAKNAIEIAKVFQDKEEIKPIQYSDKKYVFDQLQATNILLQTQNAALNQQQQFSHSLMQKIQQQKKYLTGLQTQLQHYVEKQAYFAMVQQKEHSLKQSIALKQQIILQQQSQITALKAQSTSHKQSLLNLKLQIERKNVELNQIKNRHRQDVEVTPLKMSVSTIYSQCSLDSEKQIAYLLASNLTLRKQLQATSQRLNEVEVQGQKWKKDALNAYDKQEQNRKLRETIAEMATNRGPQHRVLMGALKKLSLMHLQSSSSPNRKQNKEKSNKEYIDQMGNKEEKNEEKYKENIRPNNWKK